MALILYLLGATFMTMLSFRIDEGFPKWQHYAMGVIWPVVIAIIIIDNIFGIDIMGDDK